MGRILHLGVGSFFRAHVAWYTDALPDWRITGVSFRSPAIRDGLAAQGYAYTLVIKDAGATRTQTIRALDEMLVLPETPQAVLDRVADPAVQVITLTVTEKGYHLASDGQLDLGNPSVQGDILGAANTPVGALTRGLAMRATPVTVLCCDNLASNGRVLQRAVRIFAAAAGLDLPPGITFPSCMVDRITPATTDDIRAETGDKMAVPTEAFSEWVIEDNFATERPDWPGATWVDDVAPYEMRKLRMLNGAHSYLAYAGIARGFEYVHEAIADPDLRAGAIALMDEAAETLPDQVRDIAPDYARALVARFENPNLHHRLRQIAMDGSQKLPIRIVETMHDRDAPSPALEAAVAAWVRFVRDEIAAGRVLDDPRHEALALATACAKGDPETALRLEIGL